MGDKVSIEVNVDCLARGHIANKGKTQTLERYGFRSNHPLRTIWTVNAADAQRTNAKWIAKR
jgi:hypothetical protein